MGRGERGNKAISIRALPRLMRNPKKVGQKRYNVERIDMNDNSHREPGWIITIASDLKLFGSQMIVREEVAVEGKDGQLHWVKNEQRAYNATYSRKSPLSEARKMADHLNKNPLGPIVTKEVDEKGNLEIGYGHRKVNNHQGSELTRIEYDQGHSPEKFDVTDSEQAKKASDLFKELGQRKQLEEKENIEAVMTELANSEDKEDLQLAVEIAEGSDRSAEKIDIAERFSDALDSGGAEAIKKEIATKQNEEEVTKDKRDASRLRETLRSLQPQGVDPLD